MAHSPSLRGRGGEDASRRVPTAYLFLHLNFIILFRRHGAPEFLVFFFLLTRGRGAPSRRATDHHAPSPPENSEGNNLRNQRRVNSNTIMDNRVFATHNKTALYCAHIVSIYFLPSFLPSAALLRNHRVFFFVYIEHPPSPLYLLLLPRDTRCPRNETQLARGTKSSRVERPVVSFPRVCSSLPLSLSLSLEEEEERDGEYFHELCRVLTRHKFFNMAILRPRASLGRERERGKKARATSKRWEGV